MVSPSTWAGARIVSQIFRDHLERLTSDVGAMYIEGARHAFGEAGAWGAALSFRVLRQHYQMARQVDEAYQRGCLPLVAPPGEVPPQPLRTRGGVLAKRLVRTVRAARRAWQEEP